MFATLLNHARVTGVAIVVVGVPAIARV